MSRLPKKPLKTLWLETRSLAKTMGYCIRLAWGASRLFTIIRVASQLFAAISVIVSAFLGRTVINLLVGAVGESESSLKAKLIAYILATLAFSLFAFVLRRANEYSANMHNELLNHYVSKDLLQKSLAADIESYDTPAFYNAIELAHVDSYSLAYIVWNALTVVSSMATLISALLIIMGFNPLFGFVVVAAAVPAAVVEMRFTKLLYLWNKEHISEQRKTGYLLHLASNREYAMDIRLFNIGGYLTRKYTAIWEAFFTKRRKLVKRQSLLVILFGVLPEITIGFMMISLATSILAGHNTIGDYSLYTGLFMQLSGSVVSVISIISRIYEDRLKIANVQSFLERETNLPAMGTQTLEEPVQIEFRHVYFKYPQTDVFVLKDVSFTIEKREKVCIVGVNGTGKSTIIKLLLRFYDATDGQILLNGIDIKAYDSNSLRKQFSAYFQNALPYAMTVRENVILSDLDRYRDDDAEVMQSLTQSGAEGCTAASPGGLDTYVSKTFHEDGIELSGGQIQKLALARALYRRCSVLLLDEPSASLDPEAEHLLFNQLQEITKNKTTIFTSHRLSNVHMADRIILMEKGVVLGQGAHDVLIKQSERYATLYNYQAEKFRS